MVQRQFHRGAIRPAPGVKPNVPKDHNQPPIEDQIRSEFNDWVTADRPDFQLRYKEFIEAPSRVDINSDKDLGAAGDLIKLGKAIIQHVGDAKTAIKRPHLERCNAIDNRHNDLVDPIQDAVDFIQGRMNEYIASKEQRAREIEEQRKAALAKQERERISEKKDPPSTSSVPAEGNTPGPAPVAPPVAAAPVKRKRRIRTDAGNSVSPERVRISEIFDYHLAAPAVLGDPKVQEAIDAAIQRQVKAGVSEIPGVSITEAAKAVTR